LLTELDLIKSYGKRGEEYYVIENTEKEELPDDVLLYAILDFERFDMSVSLSSIEQEPNSVGAVFAINRTGLVNKIESIIGKNKWITFTDHAGIKEIQFKKKPEALDILETYYAN
jgi:hypothetical protein